MTEQEKDTRAESQEDGVQTADVDVAPPDESHAEPDEMGGDGFDWKEPPIFDIAHKEGCVCHVKVTIPKANVSAILEEIYDEVNDGVQIPGFRRGKAPRKLLEKRLGKYARGNAAERLAEHASQLLAEKHKLTPVSQPEIEGLDDPENIPVDEDLVYTLTFETYGKCTLGDYEAIEIEKPIVDVPDSDVDNTIENMRTRFGRFEPLSDGTAEEGDQVIIDFVGKIDGEDFEGNSAENYPYILGSKRFSPEMEEAMTGAKAGDNVTTDLTFPEDYHNADLAGKTAKFQITIHEIKRRELPELDDEFAKRVGNDTVAELRDAVRKRISESADEQVLDYMRQQARQKLVDCSEFDLPKSQIQKFVDSEYKSMEQRLMQQHVPAESIEEHREEMQKTAEEQGLFLIKSMYALRALAEKEGVTITENDFEEYTRRVSDEMQQNYEVMKEYLLSEDMRSMTEYQIVETKALDTLLDKATIVLKRVSEDDDTTAAEEKDKEESDA